MNVADITHHKYRGVIEHRIKVKSSFTNSGLRLLRRLYCQPFNGLSMGKVTIKQYREAKPRQRPIFGVL
jgi:hypothetical protein